MKFKEPIELQPIRIVEDNHICDDLDELSLWLQIPYDECYKQLQSQNGKRHIRIGQWHIEPANIAKFNKRAIRIIDLKSGEINEFESVWEASVKLGIPEKDIRSAVEGRGPWRHNFRTIYI